MPFSPRSLRPTACPWRSAATTARCLGSRGARGLTGLSAWWLRLGVEPHFIRPASPKKNAPHAEAADLAAARRRRSGAEPGSTNSAGRPHEALRQRPPADVYASSASAMPERPEDPWYDADHQVRRVGTRGEIKWRGESPSSARRWSGSSSAWPNSKSGDHVVRFCGRDLGLLGRRGDFGRFPLPRTGLRQTTDDAAQQKLSTTMTRSPAPPCC